MGRGRWKMNTAMFHDVSEKVKLQHKWAIWKGKKRFYPDLTVWWVTYVKKQFRLFVRKEEAERRKNLRQMENFLYESILTE